LSLTTGFGTLILALFALLAAAPRPASAAADPCDTQNVCFQGAVISGVRVKPPALFLTWDGSLQVIDLNWSTWASETTSTPDTAQGTGLAVYETQAPGQRISVHVIRVAVALSQIGACDPAHDVPNGLYYNRVRLTDQRTHKAVAQRYLQRGQWAPCEQSG
jgi:hypothetical protein